MIKKNIFLKFNFYLANFFLEVLPCIKIYFKGLGLLLLMKKKYILFYLILLKKNSNFLFNFLLDIIIVDYP